MKPVNQVKPDDLALDPKFDKIGYKDQVLDIINSLRLKSETDKHILKSRFLYEVLNYDARRLLVYENNKNLKLIYDTN